MSSHHHLRADKDEFQMKFHRVKTDLSLLFLAIIIYCTSSATCLRRVKWKNSQRSIHTAFLQINKELTKACSSLIIDALAKLTKQAWNPGYNLWDKYFIANICLYILCQCVLKLLQMNVKRKVSEQAVEGTEQRSSSAASRGEDSQEDSLARQINDVVGWTSQRCPLTERNRNLGKERRGKGWWSECGWNCVLLCLPLPGIGATPQLEQYSHSSTAYPRTL